MEYRGSLLDRGGENFIEHNFLGFLPFGKISRQTFKLIGRIAKSIFNYQFLIFISLFHLTSGRAWATDIQINFSSFNTSQVAVNQFIYNRSLSQLHPPMKIWGYQDGGGDPVLDRVVDIGDGSDGAFESSTYANFSTGGDVSGQVIRIDTDVKNIFQWTRFHLEAGWTILPSGTQPLIFKVQSTVVVDGLINCSGENGDDLNPSSDVNPTLGGEGRCGGANGGNGGSSTIPGQAGENNLSAVFGGGGGSGLDAGDGGAGGGAFGNPGATDADNGIGAGGGVAGSSVSDDTFLILGGGAGGGGGSDGADGSSGAGGGAGGGVIIIYALGNITVSATGQILANGGAGGGQSISRIGGGGGGGGGGSILLVSAGDVVFDGAVEADRGPGGNTDGSDGGQGAVGRTWVTDSDGVASGGVIEDPFAQLNNYGNVSYDTGDFIFQTTELDFLNTEPRLVSTSFVASGTGGSGLLLELSTSDAPAGAENFINGTSLSGQKLGRYIRLKVTGSSTLNTDPIRISQLDIDVEDFAQDDFKLQSACGRLESPPSGAGLLAAIHLILFFILLGFRWRITTPSSNRCS